jgi:DNA-binding response OmpR family regulator
MVRSRRNTGMKRILVVDDDPTYLTLEEKVLKREGYEVVTAEDGAQAMSLYREQEFDLVLLDVMMPGVDGFEVSRTLREGDRQKRVPVVFVTSKDDSKSMQEGFRSGGRVYLTKPFTNFQLVKMVKSVIGD